MNPKEGQNKQTEKGSNRGASFEELIASSIEKVQGVYDQSQLIEFNEMLDRIPKKVKELNADPYLFVFQYLFDHEELKGFALKKIDFILEENFCSKASLVLICELLKSCLPQYSNEVVNCIIKVKEPNIEVWDLFFEIYSTVILPEDVALRFRQVGYKWLIRMFSLKQTHISVYMKIIFDKIGVYEIPPLITEKEEHQQLEGYVYRVMNTMLDKLGGNTNQVSSVPNREKKGKYLYCFMCQRPADYYCKDTKVPVCSSVCKKNHLIYISQASVVNEQYSDSFKREVEEMLFRNWYVKRSPSLSVDYLTCIYIFSSDYCPQMGIQHQKIARSPIMAEKVWLLYGAYYAKKGQMFEHVFMDFLTSGIDYLEHIAREYFLSISSTHRFLEVVYNFDCIGFKRLFPAIMQKLKDDKLQCYTLVNNLIEIVFQHGIVHTKQIPTLYTKQLLEIFNFCDDPIDKMLPYLKSPENIAKFILKNQTLIDKEVLSNLASKNETFLKVLLKEIVNMKGGCLLDELLREVFLFMNVKVSEKIYRLLELLYDVYEINPDSEEGQIFKKDDSLFQYMYLILMLTTELHNPAMVKKPTISDVLSRIAVINKSLAEEHIQYVQQMFDRLQRTPFSQHTRGVLRHYPKVEFQEVSRQFYTPLIVLENYDSICDVFDHTAPQNTILYRICNILLAFPQQCQHFFKIYVQKLKDHKQEEYVLHAIRNIIQQEPNVVGDNWKVIFEHIKAKQKTQKELRASKYENGGQGSQKNLEAQQKRRRIFSNGVQENEIVWLDLTSVLATSPQLSHDNFIYFLKEFGNVFSLDEHHEEYKKVIGINRTRLHMMANGILTGFRKSLNAYICLEIVQFISELTDSVLEKENPHNSQKQGFTYTKGKGPRKNNHITMLQMKQELILIMLRQIKVNENTQELITGCIIKLCDNKSFTVSVQLWEVFTQIALKLHSEELQVVIEDLMKKNRTSDSEECYQSLMIQKTLNSSNVNLINKDVLKKLDKLEPFLQELSDDILKMFILKDNIKVIERNFQKFCHFNETYQMLSESVNLIGDHSGLIVFLGQIMQKARTENKIILFVFSREYLNFVLSMILEFDAQGQLLENHLKFIIFCLQPNSYAQKTSYERSSLFYHVGKHLIDLNKELRPLIQSEGLCKQGVHLHLLQKQYPQLISKCQKVNANGQYRQLIWKTFTFKKIKQIVGLSKQIVECKQTHFLLLLRKSIREERLQYQNTIQRNIDDLIEEYETILKIFEELSTLSKKLVEERRLELKDKNKSFVLQLCLVLSEVVQRVNQSSERQVLKVKDTRMQKLLNLVLLNGIPSAEMSCLEPVAKRKKVYQSFKLLAEQ